MKNTIKLSIFVLIIGLNQCTYTDMGVVSNALPIQFWPINGQTYNEQVNGFVRAKPYTHQWQCDDPIKLQVGNEVDPSKAYSLKVLDRDGGTIENVPYIKSLINGPLIQPSLQLPNTGFIGTLSPWLQHGNPAFQEAWAWISDGVIKSDGSLHGDNFRDSYYLYAQRIDGYSLGWPIGNYSINITGVNASTGANANTLFCQIYGSNDGAVTLTSLTFSANLPVAAFNINLPFTTSQYWKDIVIEFRIGAPGNVAKTTINSSSLTLAPTNESYTEYDLEFTANDISTPICNEFVQFIIQENGVDAYKSDYHKFSSSIAVNTFNGSKVIYYKQGTNYASLNYPNDGQYFALRIPCKFFTERTQIAQTAINLTSKVIDTSEFIKFQKWLQIPVLPDYMLKKIELILGHSIKGSLQIDDIEWTKQEAVNRAGPGGDIKYPEQMADVWLTDKNNGVRNII
jgi:hypothetical protein